MFKLELICLLAIWNHNLSRLDSRIQSILTPASVSVLPC